MLIEIKSQSKNDSLGRKTYYDLIVLKCDTCDKIWEIRGSKTRIATRKTHACSSECKSASHKNGGVVERLRAKTCVDRYGAENPYASELCKEKMRRTWANRYGVEHARSSDEVKRKARQTTIERYGERPIASKTIQDRIKKTMFERHGVEHPMQLQSVRDAMCAGSIAKYGVPYPKQNKEVVRATFEKRAREGTFFKSKSEDQCFEALCVEFGAENISRQVAVTKYCCVDFYVKSIDIYIQFDGVYWHALERPIEEIRQSGLNGNKRDMSRYRKWLVDRQQETWFTENNKTLIRFTDQQFKADPLACLLMIKHHEPTVYNA